MAHTLRSKYIRIAREAILLNPGHGDVYISGLGMITQEWAWCAELIQILRIASDIEDEEHFNEAGIKLLTYIRYRRRNPV